MPRRRLNVRQQKSAVSKRLQTELQSLIAYSCYDSADVLQCGTAAKKQTQVDKLYHRFMPSNKADDDHVSNVEQFLEGIGVFSFLFERHDAPEIDESTRDPNLPPPPPKLVIPQSLHCMDGKEICVGNDGITKSIITRRNLSNMIDIKCDTLYRHAKEVEANCKKALSICLSEDSPYRAYDGIWPSGTNQDDYLKWIRTQMFVLQTKLPVNDLVDKDDKAKNKDNEDGENASLGEDSDEEKDIDLGEEEYFKGFFAFALWGFIPPDGGDEYKSSLMATVVDTTSKAKRADGRAAIKSAEKKEKEHMKELEARGSPASIVAEDERMGKLTSLMISGREEMSKMRLFKCRQTNVEFKLKFIQSRIKEIKDDIKELKDDDDCDVDTETEIKDLKAELKKSKKTRDELFNDWEKITETEEMRRAALNMSIDVDRTVTVSNASTTSPITTSPPIKRKLDATDFANEDVVADHEEILEGGTGDATETVTSTPCV